VGTVLFYAIVIGAVALSRVIWPGAWDRRPRFRLPPAAPFHADGLPRAAKQAQRRRDLAAAQVGDYVAIVGRVVEPLELTAPVTKRRCAASDLVLTDSITGNRVARVLRAGTFVLDTGRETAVVDARGAFVRLTCDHRIEDVDRTLYDPGTIPGEVTASRITADEGIIGPGEYVLVIGVVERPTASDEAGYRNLADSRVRIAGGGVRPSVVSTVPADLHTFGR
jgi:hypothetical protein